MSGLYGARDQIQRLMTEVSTLPPEPHSRVQDSQELPFLSFSWKDYGVLSVAGRHAGSCPCTP